MLRDNNLLIFCSINLNHLEFETSMWKNVEQLKLSAGFLWRIIRIRITTEGVLLVNFPFFRLTLFLRSFLTSRRGKGWAQAIHFRVFGSFKTKFPVVFGCGNLNQLKFIDESDREFV